MLLASGELVVEVDDPLSIVAGEDAFVAVNVAVTAFAGVIVLEGTADVAGEDVFTIDDDDDDGDDGAFDEISCRSLSNMFKMSLSKFLPPRPACIAD